jgi:predicted metal-binding protein
MTLLVCRTCPRYDAHRSGEFGRAMTEALAAIAAGAGIAVRNVQCLGGCPDDGVIALDGLGKARVRFTGLDTSHAGSVVTAAAAHHASPSGAPDEWEVPAELADRLSSVTLKRPHRDDAPAPGCTPETRGVTRTAIRR